MFRDSANCTINTTADFSYLNTQRPESAQVQSVRSRSIRFAEGGSRPQTAHRNSAINPNFIGTKNHSILTDACMGRMPAASA